jgi:hypothetical protein
MREETKWRFDTELLYKHKHATLKKSFTILGANMYFDLLSIGSNATLGIRTLLTTIHDGSFKLHIK